jgi:hypothetical protein
MASTELPDIFGSGAAPVTRDVPQLTETPPAAIDTVPPSTDTAAIDQGADIVTAPPVTISPPAPTTLAPTDNNGGAASVPATPNTGTPLTGAPVENNDTLVANTGNAGKLGPLQQDSAPVIGGIDVTPPEELPVEPPAPEVDQVKVAEAVQTELKRLGCYTGGIDGDWGKGSRSALRHYFAAKKESVVTTDASEEILARLTDEQGTICEPVVVVKKSPPKTQPATQQATTSTPHKSSPPAASPAPTQNIGPKIKPGGLSGAFR